MPTLLMNEQECLTCGRFRPSHWHSCWYCNEELVRDSKYLEPYQTREHKDRQPLDFARSEAREESERFGVDPEEWVELMEEIYRENRKETLLPDNQV